MHEDRTRWNKKYTDREWTAEPSDIVRRFYSLAKPGMALDIGAGTGRNSVFLAEQGFDVVAVDIAEKGLAQMAGAHANLLPVCADPDVFEIPENRFSLYEF
ncbi:MAG: methyltransferase domain-containing protein [Thermodesulfobacteriota bacterium]|nr:methyltransferase domain-containing protein [Thermodesulfobacteriota bacterium]